jgi:DNA-binding IclR family transcriptional regulator
MPVVELARPLMSDLVNRLNLTTVLGIWDEDSVRVVAVNDRPTRRCPPRAWTTTACCTGR